MIVRLSTQAGLSAMLLEHGRTWKAKLFHFLVHKLAEADDFDVRYDCMRQYPQYSDMNSTMV